MIRSGDEPIPGYRVEQKLGCGQYGEVWRVSAPGGSMVALKFLDMTGRTGWKEFRSVQRVKQIRHAHLMPIVALWLLDENGQILTDDAVESLASEDVTSAKTISLETHPDARPPARMIIATLLGDQSLRDRLDECRAAGWEGIPVNELIGYMQEASKGIDHLNSTQHDWEGGQVGVQHCDIKPDNILLTGGSIMICDFGVAQIHADQDSAVRATSLSGSPAYMAPEAFEAKPSRASDQYSLAVTYYELRTGQLPLEEENFAAAYNAHRSGTLDFSQVSAREQEVLRRATNMVPEHRYGSAVEFVQALRATTLDSIPGQKSVSIRAWLAAISAAISAVVVISIGMVVLLRWDWGPHTVEVKICFDAPDVRVLIDDKEYTVGANGRLVLDVKIDVPLRVAAFGNLGRKDQQWQITAADVAANSTFDFSIPYTAAYHAAEAYRLLAAGRMNKAVEEYGLALQDAPDQYARLPEPNMHDMPGMMWDECLQVTPAGDWLIMGGKDGAVRRWKIGPEGVAQEPQLLHRHDSARIVNLAVNDSLVASSCDLGTVWITRAGAAEQLIVGDGMETVLTISGGGDWLVAATADSLATQLVAWDTHSAVVAQTYRVVGSQPGDFPRLIGCLRDAVVLATKDVHALVWKWRINPPSHKELGRQQNDVLSLSASEDGKIVAYAGVANSNSDTPEAAIIDVEANIHYRLAARQSDSILACALDDNGHLLVTAERIGKFDDTGTVWVWQPNLTTGVALADRALQFHRDLADVSALVVSRGAEWIVAGHESGAVSLWYGAETGTAPLLTFGRGDHVVALRMTSNQRWLISGARDGRVMVFDLRRLEMLQRACRRADIRAKIDRDKVTLRDRFVPHGPHFLWGNGGTGFHLSGRPSGAPV